MIYFIYNAEGSLMGEIRYFKDKIFKKKNCQLCSMAYNVILPNPAWKIFRDTIPEKHGMYHIDELPQHIKDYCEEYPCVIREQNNFIATLISARELTKIGVDLDIFIIAFTKALSR